MNRPEVTPEQLARLESFAREHGPRWRDVLRELWWTGRDDRQPDGHLLRQVRNRVGPRLLDRVEVNA